MNSQFLHLLGITERLMDAKKIQSARAVYDEIMGMEWDPETQALSLYNSAAFQYDFLADGVKAVDLFEKTYAHFEKHPEINSNPKIAQFLAFTCENRMLLSLSYVEYELWAGRLRQIAPDEPILSGQVPLIHEKQEAGSPWSEMLQMIACSYYNRNDPQLDPGQYSRAAAVYQLLLENRRMLRLSREGWSQITYEYGALLEKLNMNCLRYMENEGQSYPDECRFYLDLARSRVDEFIQANQPNKDITFLSDSLNKMIEMSNQGNRGLAPSIYPGTVIELKDPSQFQPSILACLPSLVLIGGIFYAIGKIFHWW